MKKHILNSAKTGDVWALSLGEGEYGYVRIFRGGCLGVIPVLSRGAIRDVSQLSTYPTRWFFGFAAPPTDNTEMVRTGAIPFPNEDEAWPPPRYVPPDIFKGYFQIWDKGMQRQADERETEGLQKVQMATPDWLRQFILNHRSECTLIEGGGRLGSLADDRGNPKDNSGPILLEIVFRNSDFPFRGRDAVEDPLAEALEEAGIGEVTGGGSGPETCAIDVEVTDTTRGLEIVQQTLRRLGCPASTEIHQHQPQHVIHRL